MTAKRILIGGGGTGGHIFPALAVGRKLREKDASLELTFVGTSRAVEKTIMEKSGMDFIPLKIEGLKGKGLKAIKSLALLPLSFFKSWRILRRLKPALVIGAGGYSSGPIVLLASLARIPTLVLEQNVEPGFTNRILRPWIRKAVVSFESTLPAFKGKGVLFGNPVREEFYDLKPKPRDGRLSILVFGGSQGSRFLNKGMTAALPFLKPEKDRLVFCHQTGTDDGEWVRREYADSGFGGAVIEPFFFNMAERFEAADLIVSRAGATSVAELVAGRKASILVPFAGAAENHQEKNARELGKKGGALVITETEFSPELLARRIVDFLKNPDRITRMEDSLKALQTERPAEKIVGLCFELMGAA